MCYLTSPLWSLLEDVVAEAGILPLVHVTDAANFSFIRTKGVLEPKRRPDYKNEEILFLFYGRPSYRVNAGVNTLDTKSFAPICLILNHDIISKSWRIMPFDTGAFNNGELTPPIHPTMTADQFELVCDPTAPMRLIKFFFGTERNYFDANPLPSVPIERWTNFPADSYDRLIRNQANSKMDDRVSAIEIQLAKPLELFNNVRAIILPKEFLDQPGMLECIQSWRDALPITYDLPQSYDPKEIMGTIRQKVRDFYVQRGYFQ
jgi:hypothetical protein